MTLVLRIRVTFLRNALRQTKFSASNSLRLTVDYATDKFNQIIC